MQTNRQKKEKKRKVVSWREGSAAAGHTNTGSASWLTLTRRARLDALVPGFLCQAITFSNGNEGENREENLKQ